MLRPLLAILWAFLGVRKRSESEQDFRALRPLQVIGLGLLLALVFVVSIMLVVSMVVPPASR